MAAAASSSVPTKPVTLHPLVRVCAHCRNFHFAPRGKRCPLALKQKEETRRCFELRLHPSYHKYSGKACPYPPPAPLPEHSGESSMAGRGKRLQMIAAAADNGSSFLAEEECDGSDFLLCRSDDEQDRYVEDLCSGDDLNPGSEMHVVGFSVSALYQGGQAASDQLSRMNMPPELYGITAPRPREEDATAAKRIRLA